jgi:hypothetical protein
MMYCMVIFNRRNVKYNYHIVLITVGKVLSS